MWAAIGVGGSAPASGGEGITNMVRESVYQKTPHHAAIRGLILHDIDRNTNEIGEVGILYWGMRVAVVAGFSRCRDRHFRSWVLRVFRMMTILFTGGIPSLRRHRGAEGFLVSGRQVFANLNTRQSALCRGGAFSAVRKASVNFLRLLTASTLAISFASSTIFSRDDR